MAVSIRIYYSVLGGHVHMSVFSGTELNRGKAGDLCMTVDEFLYFRMHCTTAIEFVAKSDSQVAI